MPGKDRKFILLSFDVEEFDIPLKYNQRIGENEQLLIGHKGLLNIMEMLGGHEQVTGTFFTTSHFAKRFPESIRKISLHHEIASHTCFNSSFKINDLLISKNELETIIQKPIFGLRMPQMQEPVMDIVSKVPYAYDASLNPTWIPGHYNNLRKSRTTFHEKGVIRIPASVSPNLRIPLFWLSFKNFPYSYFKYLANAALKKDGYLSLYFHPWEFTDISCYSIPWYTKRPDNYVLLNKLHRLINDFKNETDFIGMHDFSNQI